MLQNRLIAYSSIFMLLLLLTSMTLVQDAKAQCGDTTVTQSTSQEINGGFSCGALPVSFFRAFELSTFGIEDDFNVCAVEVGVSPSSTPQNLIVNLYTSDPAFPDGARTLIGTTNYVLNDGFGIVNVPVSGNAPAGSELVVEVFSPGDTEFVIGTNNSPETGPSYLQSAPCGFPEVTTTDEAQSPGSHFVINVIGNEPRNVPTLSEWGLIAMAGVLGIVGFMVIKRRKVTA